MSINKPYHRNVRQFIDGEFSEGGRWKYILHEEYAKSPEHYIRAFLIIQKDLHDLFDYVEPAEKNQKTYSFRTHELLFRTCVEIEANCVAILTENGYQKSSNLNMSDYKKINETHRLSSYEVKLPVWNGQNNIRKPFSKWETGGSLDWYNAYNITKHNRHTEFEQATFDNLIEAICGLVAILASQFLTHDFSPSDCHLSVGGIDDGMESAIGGYFRIKFAADWKNSEKYDFNWQQIKNDPNPFQNYSYT
jgi:hypothetical protein